MSIALDTFETSVRPVGPPGVYMLDRHNAASAAPALESGVPVFIGFASPDPDVWERGHVPAITFDRWSAAKFGRLVQPHDNSFLHLAVRGFFANGGRRCVVFGVAPGQGSNGMMRALERGGPLDDRSDIDLVCLPDISLASDGDQPNIEHAVYEVQGAALSHCEAMGDRFAILDAPKFQATGGIPVNTLLASAAQLRSPFGALYYPWVVSDPEFDQDGERVASISPEWRCLRQPSATGGHHALRLGPPCGHVAGLFARIDRRVGVQRAPANALLQDVVDTSVRLSDGEHSALNAGGINCLRSLRGGRIEVGGARTRSGHAVWTFISTARVILNFRRWLVVGLRDLVFEPQTPLLWERVRRRLETRCLEMLRDGALAGADPASAFFVKCDAETNPPDEVDQGRIVALVGLAPSVPTEYIVLRIDHQTNGTTQSNLLDVN